MKLLKLIGLVAVVLGLGACSDYYNRHDSVTFAAGDAQAWNRVVQTTDPWPPHARNLDIDGDGQRTAQVVRAYSTRPPGAGAAAPTGAAAAAR
jgi:hypothetical protein